MAPAPPFPHYRDFNGGRLPATAGQFLFRFLATRFRWRVALLIVGTLGGIGFMSLEPLFLRDLVEALRTGGHQPWAPAVWLPFLLVAGSWLISSAFNRFRDVVDLHTAPQLRYEVQTCLFSYLIEHSPAFFHANFAGRLAQKVRQAGDSVVVLLGILFNEMVRVAAAMVIGTVLVGLDHPAFSALLIGWTAGFVTAATLLSRRCLTLSKTVSDQASTASGLLVDIIGNSDLVRAFARLPYECAQVATAMAGERDAQKRLRWFLVRMWTILFTSVVLFQAAMIALAVRATVIGEMVVGETVMMVSLSTILWTNIWGLATRMLEFLEQIGVLSSALDSIVVPHAITDAPGAGRLVVTRGEIVMKGVVFAHDGGRPVFDGLDLTVRAGEKVGLVGPSGAGKSTLVRLLRRHHQPQYGHIEIDGQDIALVTQQSLAEAIAEVPQQPGLFHRGIAENIAYGRFDATPDDLAQAADRAHCLGFIDRRPEGYDAQVGEHGVQLSGGERQRVAIARALLKDAPIVILDEATSALDSETEHEIGEALRQLLEGRTVIAIAHRLSTISRMDRILYLEDGRVVEQGGHAELLERGGRYAHMWHRQSGGFIV